MRSATRKTFAIVAAATAAVLVGGGVAVAYWSTTGTGTGTATAGTSTTVTVAQTGTITGLYPGMTAVPIAVSITNPGPSQQRITTLAITISSITGGTPTVNDPVCDATDFTVASTYTATTLAVGANAFPTAGTIKLNDTGINQDACKNVTVNLAYAAS